MTTDHAAFLARIIAEPDRDEHRLIYADYLDERNGSEQCSACTDKSGFCWGKVADCRTCNGIGEINNGFAERAEFIRVQCRIDEIEASNGKPEFWCRIDEIHATTTGDGRPRLSGHTVCQCERCRLRRREEKLIYGERSSWHDWVPKFAGLSFSLSYPSPMTSQAPSARFHRGFVEEIACSWSDWTAHADAIRASTPLRKVKLTTWPMFSERDMGRLTSQELFKRDYPDIEFELPSLTPNLRGEIVIRRNENGEARYFDNGSQQYLHYDSSSQEFVPVVQT